MRISDWSSDLCSSDLSEVRREQPEQRTAQPFPEARMLGVVQQQLFGVLPSIGEVRGQLLGEWIVVDLDIQLEIQQQAARVPVGAADHRLRAVDNEQFAVTERPDRKSTRLNSSH